MKKTIQYPTGNLVNQTRGPRETRGGCEKHCSNGRMMGLWPTTLGFDAGMCFIVFFNIVHDGAVIEMTMALW